MAQTKHMRADEIAYGFNGVNERKYWKAAVAGSRVNPEVHFNSRASMVQIVYRISTEDFTVTFAKSNAAFGDFLASAHRSMEQVLTGLKAAGLPFTVSEPAALRLEYNPLTKDVVAWLPSPADAWPEAEPLPFKVPVREKAEKAEIPLDAESTDE